MIQAFPTPPITIISFILLAVNFEATDSLMNEQSAPEYKQNKIETRQPYGAIYQLVHILYKNLLDVRGWRTAFIAFAMLLVNIEKWSVDNPSDDSYPTSDVKAAVA